MRDYSEIRKAARKNNIAPPLDKLRKRANVNIFAAIVCTISLGVFVNYRINDFIDESTAARNDIKIVAAHLKKNQMEVDGMAAFLTYQNGYDREQLNIVVE